MPNSSAEENLRLWFERVWNQNDESAIDELFAPDGMVHGLPNEGGGPIRGREEFKSYARSLRAAIPDVRVEILRFVANGDLASAHCVVTGTHTGDGLGLRASGRPVRFEGIVMGRVADGHLQESWNSFDFMTFFQQVGATPPV
ncbi:MAG: ester cyclase [Bryobacteraceae bacterium]